MILHSEYTMVYTPAGARTFEHSFERVIAGAAGGGGGVADSGVGHGVFW